MATGVGLHIVEDAATATIATDCGDPVCIVRETILHMSDDGDTVLGGPAPAGHTYSITGFVGAIGDPAGVTVDDGEAYRAEDLVAAALFCLINLSAEHLSGPAEFYATHPAHWPEQYVRGLREALDYLGLRSVVLVSESDLPEAATAEPCSTSAPHRAAAAALAAVLATPAGATPPDSTDAENSLVVTDVMPAVSTPASQARAYSAAIPFVEPGASPPDEPATGLAAPVTVPTKAKPTKRTPVLIVAAALIGLVLGGFGVSLLLHSDDPTPTPPPPLPDARSEPVSVSPTAGPQTPPPIPEPAITEPPVTVIHTTEPETTTPPPEPTTTTAEPTTTATTTPGMSTTTRARLPRRTPPSWFTPYTVPTWPIPPPR